MPPVTRSVPTTRSCPGRSRQQPGSLKRTEAYCGKVRLRDAKRGNVRVATARDQASLQIKGQAAKRSREPPADAPCRLEPGRGETNRCKGSMGASSLQRARRYVFHAGNITVVERAAPRRLGQISEKGRSSN